jgi:hypothetical protein
MSLPPKQAALYHPVPIYQDIMLPGNRSRPDEAQPAWNRVIYDRRFTQPDGFDDVQCESFRWFDEAHEQTSTICLARRPGSCVPQPDLELNRLLMLNNQ